MKLLVAKWGNSLVVRLPLECTRATGLQEGDSVEVSITPTGEITLTPEKVFDKAAFLARLSKLHATLSVTKPVVEQMRQVARY